MGGLSAISAGNGWLIAALGVSVVFFGLASLAFLISFFPRLIGWWNHQSPGSLLPRLKGQFILHKRSVSTAKISIEDLEPGDLGDAEDSLRLLTAHMGEPFHLPRLLELAEHRGLAKVHSIINRLLVRGAMVGGPDGLFRWAKKTENAPPAQNGRT